MVGGVFYVPKTNNTPFKDITEKGSEIMGDTSHIVTDLFLLKITKVTDL